MKIPDTVTVSIDSLTPYWRNPRMISQEAIDAVRHSLETYGYQQPIVTDTDYVIIVGHTRYFAMKDMGVSEVDVYVSSLDENKAKEYRLVDNRTQEFSAWDGAALVAELREMESDVLTRYFPDTDLELETLNDSATTEDEVTRAEEALANTAHRDKAVAMTAIECPSCREDFQIRTSSLPGIDAADLEELTLRAQE